MEWSEHDLSGHLLAIGDDGAKTYWIDEQAWVYLSVSDFTGIRVIGTFHSVEDAKAEAEEHNKAA